MTIEHQPPALQPSRQPSSLWIILALFILAIATFARAISNDFINYDDPGYVTENRHVLQGLTPPSIAWAFRDLSSQSNWHPLTWMSHMLDVELFGLSPGGHHFTNIVLHAINTVLLYLLLRRLTLQPLLSAVVAALFAVHPTHVESVAWISERKDVLSACFALLTLFFYAGYAMRSSRGSYTLALATFALGLMSKPMLVTLPFVMLLLDAWPLRRLDRARAARCVVEKIPFFVLTLAGSTMAFVAQHAGGSVGSLDRYPLDQRLANAVVSIGRYLLKTLWPADLAVFYPYPPSHTVAVIIASCVVLVVLSLIALCFGRARPWLFVGWFWFVGMLVPVIGIVQVGRQSMADRYLYLPHVGLFVALVWSVNELLARRPALRQPAGVLAVMIIAACSIATFQQIGHWKDSQSLFTHALQVTEDNYLAHAQLANDLARSDALAQAEAHYRAALEIHPDHAHSHMNLGNLLARRGLDERAIAHLRRAVAITPTLSPAYVSLGYLLARNGDLAAAEQAFANALAADPDSAVAEYQWGIALRDAGDTARAADHFRAALAIDPAFQPSRQALRALQQPTTQPNLRKTTPSL